MALPFVDVSPFLTKGSPSSPAKVASAKSLYDACHDVGFFYLKGHGIPQDRCEFVLDTVRRWMLTATKDEKAVIARKDAGVDDGDGARGYQKIGENVTLGKSDFHEAIDLYATHTDTPPCPPYKPIEGRNLWPNPDFEATFTSYIDDVLSLGAALMRCMAVALSLPEDYFESFITPSFWVCRAIGYPPLTEAALENNPGGVSCGAHSDYGCWTFLLADDTKGALKVQSKDGVGWIDADPIEGAYVVNVGDMLMQWTNGLFKSTVHQVVHLGSNYRVSVPVFFEPSWDAKISPLQTCIERTGGKALYGEVQYGEYLLGKVSSNFYAAPPDGK
ncbi:hypothetical protein H072_11490 [Dactylellina haptotyla CBS 200.50]|uniref:Fe2OG dioxygenase domain-containing protein n=1 Tax=Dactylellina haptotyla (strain CBS 200.50) TaxID=1284197 RepID=S7ZWG6_DACHA|nr:hypothetical protein H072_11490 [Dactylellina haptotyla CBS 200.50]